MYALYTSLIRIVHLVILLSLFGLQSVARATPPTPMAVHPVVFGTVYSLSGEKADMGEPSARGARLASEQINGQGGVNGRPLQLVLQDSKSSPTAAGQAVTAILHSNPDVSAMFGLSDTDLARAAGETAAGHHLLFLSSGATSPLLPAQVPNYLYLACFGDNAQAAAAAEWSYRHLGARTAAVIYDDTETYTRLLQEYFIMRFQSLNGRIAAVKSYKPESIARIGQNLPAVDMVFLSAGNAKDALKGIRSLRDSGVAVPIVGGDGYDSESTWESHPGISDVYYTTHVYLRDDNADSLVRNFSRTYHSAYGGNPPDAFAALAYDSVNLLVEAVKRAGSTTPDAVRQALAKIDDFKGVTGKISYAGGRHIPHKSVTIVGVQKGRRNFITSFMPEVIPEKALPGSN